MPGHENPILFTTIGVAEVIKHDVGVVAVEVNDVAPAVTAPEKFDGKKYLYRGILSRSFERRIHLAEHIKVTGANLEDGVLFVDLERRLPEELRARTIEIEAGPAQKVIESKAA